MKFQSVAIPNGLKANLYGPVEGRRRDAGMLKESGLLNILQREARTLRGEPLCLYGDPAYPLRPELMGLYRDADVLVVTTEMRAFNTAIVSLLSGSLGTLQNILSLLITRKTSNSV